MDTKVLEYIIAIANEKNISRAADLFYLTQPVLSRHLKSIEEDVGTKLFYREKGEMRLTDAGKIYINNARAILYTEQKMLQDLADLRREGKRTIRIMIDPYLSRLFNRTVLPAFEAENTQFELEMSEGDYTLCAAALANDLVDFGVVKSGPVESSNLEIISLYADEMVLAVPRAWMEADSAEKVKSQGPWAFRDRCFLMERSDSVMRQVEQRIMQHFQFRPRMVYEVSGSATALQMVKNQHGAAFLQKALVEAHRPDVIPLSFDPPEAFHAYAVYPKRRMLRPAEKTFLKILKESFQSLDEYMKQLAGEA